MQLAMLSKSFQKLEHRVRRAIFWHGMLDVIAIVAVAGLLSFFADRLIELPWILRLAVLAAVIALVARSVAVHGRRRRGRFRIEELLATVESRHPDLDGQLFNAYELTREIEEARAEGNEALVRYLKEAASRESRRSLGRIAVESSLDWAPVRRRAALAGGAIMAFLGVA